MEKAILLLVFAVATATAQTEASISDPWCEARGGEAQVMLPDGTEADCITRYHAIEADFAHKWYEAVGQSLHYARVTGKLPGILIIRKSAADERYLRRLYAVIHYYQLPIMVWEVER